MNPSIPRALFRTLGVLLTLCGLFLCLTLSCLEPARTVFIDTTDEREIKLLAFSGDNRFVFALGSKTVNFQTVLWRRELATGREREFVFPAAEDSRSEILAVSHDGSQVVAGKAWWKLSETSSTPRCLRRLTVQEWPDDAWFARDPSTGAEVVWTRADTALIRYGPTTTRWASLTFATMTRAERGTNWLAFVEKNPRAAFPTLVLRRLDSLHRPESEDKRTRRISLKPTEDIFRMTWDGDRLWIVTDDDGGDTWKPSRKTLARVGRTSLDAPLFASKFVRSGNWAASIPDSGGSSGAVLFDWRAPNKKIPIFAGPPRL